jgi:hypothetical protein
LLEMCNRAQRQAEAVLAGTEWLGNTDQLRQILRTLQLGLGNLDPAAARRCEAHVARLADTVLTIDRRPSRRLAPVHMRLVMRRRTAPRRHPAPLSHRFAMEVLHVA